ncbi:MAG: hypothetical protein QOH96_1720 [Blastocatellia bacterium]|nr:hypothetical protein [Blastocatellia bacterium]
MSCAKTLLFVFVICSVSVTTSCARHNNQGSSNAESNSRAANIGPIVRVSSENGIAAEPALAAAGDGGVYVVWIEHRDQEADVMFTHFSPDSKTQEPAIRVNPESGMATAWRGDPPTIAVAPDGTIFVGWTTRAQSPFGHATNIVLSASSDRGKSFAKPVKVNDDQKPAVHGMHSLAVGADGHVYMAWLDERNIPQPEPSASAEGHHNHAESNREVFVTSSTDGGRTFASNRRAAVDVCPCCKTALAVGTDRRVYLSWRQVLPGDFRHIALASSTDDAQTFSSPVIVSDDQWVLNGCPVSGATLSAGTEGIISVLWYAEGEKGQPGLYTSRSSDGGRTFTPRELVAASSAHGTPVLLSGGTFFSAVWEGANHDGVTQVMTTKMKDGQKRPMDLVISGDGHLPAAVLNGDRLFVAFVKNINDHPGVFVTSALKKDLYGEGPQA